jgi:Zn-dependent protease with chaperone function
VGSVLGPLVLERVSHDGIAGLLDSGDSLLPVLLFIVLVVAGLALGARSITRQIIASSRLARRVRGLALELPDELALAASEVGLGGRVVLLAVPERFSFAYGVLTPRVAISQGLVEGVSDEELRAVLEHEHYHVCNLDPLKVVLVQALSAAFFFLPILDSLRARYLAGREFAADRRAVRACGRRPLVGALLKVVRGPDWSELEGVAAIGGSELLDVVSRIWKPASSRGSPRSASSVPRSHSPGRHCSLPHSSRRCRASAAPRRFTGQPAAVRAPPICSVG